MGFRIKHRDLMIMVLTCLISFDIVTLSIVVFEKLEPRKFITAWYPHVCVCAMVWYSG